MHLGFSAHRLSWRKSIYHGIDSVESEGSAMEAPQPTGVCSLDIVQINDRPFFRQTTQKREEKKKEAKKKKNGDKYDVSQVPGEVCR